ncbi:RNA 2'-phosphotransferase [Microvirga massiliensis]|uniref:RNA 2'-phosphotransferase n=1 Tax=Microvirga massiliensis TaxID=1033741 RepID=UPI00062BEFEC|nr:RNA 2'-phosphotransferase [Microvirga massiliensis]
MAPQSSKQIVRHSKFLSYILRHAPQSIGLQLDPSGWANVDELLAKAAAAGHALDRPILETIVATNTKKRFALSVDRQRIRAVQGHSIPIDLGLAPSEPPQALFHGTATRFLEPIWREGLTPRSRRQVHLSADPVTAMAVGRRHGTPVVLVIDTARMRKAGHLFYRADNGVWLTDHVPPEFLREFSNA